MVMSNQAKKKFLMEDFPRKKTTVIKIVNQVCKKYVIIFIN